MYVIVDISCFLIDPERFNDESVLKSNGKSMKLLVKVLSYVWSLSI